MKENKTILKEALIRSLPITGSYLFVSMAYGLMMQNAGFGWLYSLIASLTIYTGAFQFLLVAFLCSGASYLTIALTAVFMNSRQFFYGLTFLDDFKEMGRRYPYMVHTMTDETYAVNCAILPKQEETAIEKKHRRNVMFFVALFSRVSWMAGSVLGGVLGQVIPIELEGIDFCMTALFVTIFVDQWRSMKTHVPAIMGLLIGVLLLLVLGPNYFLLPTLILVSGILLVLKNKMESTHVELKGEES